MTFWLPRIALIVDSSLGVSRLKPLSNRRPIRSSSGKARSKCSTEMY